MPIIAQIMLLSGILGTQKYHCIFRLVAININNVVNYCSNIHDISFRATNLC